jgi:hypothetical protein
LPRKIVSHNTTVKSKYQVEVRSAPHLAKVRSDYVHPTSNIQHHPIKSEVAKCSEPEPEPEPEVAK